MSHREHRLLKPAIDTPLQTLNQQHYRSTTQRWHAVQSRDPRANIAFYYGAVTTSIYCRPTCPGRVARRSNIVFFDTTSIATQHGYRPCKRCSPELDVWDRDAHARELVRRAEGLIQELSGKQENWTVDEVAKQLGIGAAHLHRLFRKHLGRTPKASGRQRDGSLPAIDRQLHAVDALSADYDIYNSPDSTSCPTSAEHFDFSLDFDFDFDFFCDSYLPESDLSGSSDICTILPVAERVDLPSVDENWTDWLSI